MIRKVKREEIPRCVEVIRESFRPSPTNLDLRGKTLLVLLHLLQQKSDYISSLTMNKDQCMCLSTMKEYVGIIRYYFGIRTNVSCAILPYCPGTDTKG